MRIRKRSDYRKLSQFGDRFVGRSVLIQFEPAPIPQLGITVTRKFGNAVSRNRFKRLAREAFRLMQKDLPPFSMVVLPKKGATDYTLDSIQSDYLEFSDAQSPTTAGR